MTDQIFGSIMLGFGLAMDAFSVSVANGLCAPEMSVLWALAVPATFAAFQFAMPLIGWFCVRTIAGTFAQLQRAIPWAGALLLICIGTGLLRDGVRGGEAGEMPALSIYTLALEGLATSIDALSAGFAIAGYSAEAALTACGIIAGVTFLLCLAGVRIGRRFGAALSGRASILGGAMLIAIAARLLRAAM